MWTARDMKVACVSTRKASFCEWGEASPVLSWYMQAQRSCQERKKSEEIMKASEDTASQAGPSVAICEEQQSGGWMLKPYRVAQPPPLRSLRCGLPSPKYPSDHISLIADFCISRQ